MIQIRYEMLAAKMIVISMLITLVSPIDNSLAEGLTQESEGMNQTAISAEAEPISEQQRVGWFEARMQLPRLIQRISGKGTLVVDNATDGLTLSEFSTSASVMVPDLFFDTESMFSLTPSFSVVGVEAPTGIDLPATLYQSGVTLGWMKRSSDTVITAWELRRRLLQISKRAKTPFV